MTKAVICPACGSERHRASSAGTVTFAGQLFEYRRCRGCGGLFVSPPPTDATLAQMYAPQYLEQHYSTLEPGNELSEESLGVAHELSRRFPGGRVLDVGCGAGAFMRACVNEGLVAEGYEYSSETAQSVARKTGLRVQSGQLAQVDGSFDVVHFADVLEHAVSPRAMLADATRLLNPGGVVVARGPLEGGRTLFDVVMQVRRRARAFVKPVVGSLPPWHLILFSLSGWHALRDSAGLIAGTEVVSEVRWPAPPNGVRGLVRTVSIGLSSLPGAHALGLGNRVVSYWSARG